LYQVFLNKDYTLFCNKEELSPGKFLDLERVKEVTISILKKKT